MASIFFIAEWGHSRLKWRHPREKAARIQLVWERSFTVVITTLTSQLCKWCSELHQFTVWIISPHLLSLFHHHYYFVSVRFLPAFLSASRQAGCPAPSAHMLLYPLGAAGCFLTGTQLVLVSGFLYNRHLIGFPPLWKFSFHSETSFLFLPMLTVSWKCMFAFRRRLGFIAFLQWLKAYAALTSQLLYRATSLS